MSTFNSNNFSLIFQIIWTNTQELNNQQKLNFYRNKGLVWMRKRHRSFDEITRNPTIGTRVELSTYPDYDSVHIDSIKGRKLIKKLCYF